MLDELGSLEQGVALAGVLGEVLVEVAEEPRAPIGVGEVVYQAAGVGVLAAEQLEDGGGTVGRRGQRPQGIVGTVEQRPHPR